MIKDVEREDIEFISKTLHCLPIAHVDHMRPEKLGHAALVEEADVSRPPTHTHTPCRLHSPLLVPFWTA